MDKRLPICMIKQTTLLIFLLFSSISYTQTPVKVATGEWAPFITKDTEHLGYISQIISEAFAQVDRDVEFLFRPWPRAYQNAKEGEVDATSYWYKDERHAEHFYFSDPLSKDNVVFFRIKSSNPITWNTLSDLDQYSISLTRGYTYNEDMWRYAMQNPDRIAIVGSDEQNLKMLLLERIDITPVQDVVGWHLIHKLFAKEQVNRIEVMQPPLTTKTGHLLFPKVNKNSLQLLEQFNQGLKKLKESGRLYELKEKLILGEYSK